VPRFFKKKVKGGKAQALTEYAVLAGISACCLAVAGKTMAAAAGAVLKRLAETISMPFP